MKFAKLLKTLRWLFLGLLAYLLIAACRAWTVFDAALGSVPVPAPVHLSAWQQQVLLKVEDPTFFQHHGVSMAEGQGLTTISSAPARDLYLVDGRLDGISGQLQRV